MNEIEEVFYSVIRRILPSFDSDAIRRVHQAFGMPSFSNTEDRIFFDVVEADADVAKQVYFDDGYDSQKDRIARTHERTITLNLNVIVYGPNSYDLSIKIRDGFFFEETRRLLRENSLFLVPYHQPTRFFPENLNGVWYNRYDFEITFNRAWSSDSEELNYISQTEIHVEGE